MDKPKLTIAIPTLNRAAMLSQLVRRCLAQTVDRLEIVVSDDASNDDTLARLNELTDPRLTVLRQPERIGMIPNWNACLAAATGEFFVLVSDDDMIDEDFVESIERVLVEAPDVDMLIVRGRILNELTGETGENPAPPAATGYIDFVRDLLPYWLNWSFAIPFASMVFRTEALRSRGGFTTEFPFASDVATAFPIAIRGHCAFCPEAKFLCRIHAGMATRTYSAEALIDDVMKLTELVIAEVRKVRSNEMDLVESVEYGAKLYRRRSFGYFMIMSARRGLSQWQILRVWLKYWRQLPGYGLGPMSLGAVLVPRPLIQYVGWPYRRFATWQQSRRAKSNRYRAMKAS